MASFYLFNFSKKEVWRLRLVLVALLSVFQDSGLLESQILSDPHGNFTEKDDPDTSGLSSPKDTTADHFTPVTINFENESEAGAAETPSRSDATVDSGITQDTLLENQPALDNDPKQVKPKSKQKSPQQKPQKEDEPKDDAKDSTTAQSNTNSAVHFYRLIAIVSTAIALFFLVVLIRRSRKEKKGSYPALNKKEVHQMLQEDELEAALDYLMQFSAFEDEAIHLRATLANDEKLHNRGKLRYGKYKRSRENAVAEILHLLQSIK